MPADAGLRPTIRPGEFVFVTADSDTYVDVSDIVACVAEPEGRSLVLTREVADRHNLRYQFVAGWITLEVTTSLEMIGLTALVSRALADAHIACNVIAGFHHDHLLVPHERATHALEIVMGLNLEDC